VAACRARFTYQLLQGYDFLHMSRAHGVRVQARGLPLGDSLMPVRAGRAGLDSKVRVCFTYDTRGRGLLDILLFLATRTVARAGADLARSP
jgi:hypothetical protein